MYLKNALHNVQGCYFYYNIAIDTFVLYVFKI